MYGWQEIKPGVVNIWTLAVDCFSSVLFLKQTKGETFGPNCSKIVLWFKEVADPGKSDDMISEYEL